LHSPPVRVESSLLKTSGKTLFLHTFSHFRQKPFLQNSACDATTAAALEDAEQGGGI
jgi:hypothetical protein